MGDPPLRMRVGIDSSIHRLAIFGCLSTICERKDRGCYKFELWRAAALDWGRRG